MKKAYTLLEILIVVIILALMIWVFGFYLPNRSDEQVKFGKECSNYINNEINNSYKEIIQGHWEVFSWELNRIFKFALTSYWTTIQLRKFYENNENISKNLKYQNNKYICKSTTGEPEYWDYPWYIITKNNWNNYDHRWYRDGSPYINRIIINSCDQSWSCIPISEIFYNQVLQEVEQKFCLDFTWETCNEWEQ